MSGYWHITHLCYLVLFAFSNIKFTNNTYPFEAITSFFQRLMTRGAKRDRVRWSSTTLLFKFMYIDVNNLAKRLRCLLYGARKNVANTKKNCRIVQPPNPPLLLAVRHVLHSCQKLINPLKKISPFNIEFSHINSNWIFCIIENEMNVE